MSSTATTPRQFKPLSLSVPPAAIATVAAPSSGVDAAAIVSAGAAATAGTSDAADRLHLRELEQQEITPRRLLRSSSSISYSPSSSNHAYNYGHSTHLQAQQRIISPTKHSSSSSGVLAPLEKSTTGQDREDHGNGDDAGEGSVMRKTDKAVELKGKVIVPSVADDLLHFIAKKERKCLDLRQELKRNEIELQALKSKWEAIVAKSIIVAAATASASSATTTAMSGLSLKSKATLGSTRRKTKDQDQKNHYSLRSPSPSLTTSILPPGGSFSPSDSSMGLQHSASTSSSSLNAPSFTLHASSSFENDEAEDDFDYDQIGDEVDNAGEREGEIELGETVELAKKWIGSLVDRVVSNAANALGSTGSNGSGGISGGTTPGSIVTGKGGIALVEIAERLKDNRDGFLLSNLLLPSSSPSSPTSASPVFYPIQSSSLSASPSSASPSAPAANTFNPASIATSSSISSTQGISPSSSASTLTLPTSSSSLSSISTASSSFIPASASSSRASASETAVRAGKGVALDVDTSSLAPVTVVPSQNVDTAVGDETSIRTVKVVRLASASSSTPTSSAGLGLGVGLGLFREGSRDLVLASDASSSSSLPSTSASASASLPLPTPRSRLGSRVVERSPARARPLSTFELLGTAAGDAWAWGGGGRMVERVTESETFQSSKRATLDLVDSFERTIVDSLSLASSPSVNFAPAPSSTSTAPNSLSSGVAASNSNSAFPTPVSIALTASAPANPSAKASLSSSMDHKFLPALPSPELSPE